MLPLNDRPIGVFDSGLGGLTVARAMRQRLPGENLIYLGDTARVPYGVKSAVTVRRFAVEAMLFLLNQGVKMIVVACNTVSAVALPHLRELLRAPLVGVVEPGAKAALRASTTHRIGVIGTPSTIKSGAYIAELLRWNSQVQVWGRACPLLVPLVEEGRLGGEVVELTLNEYLKPLLKQKIDVLILGCTHYPLLKPAIQKACGPNIVLVDSAESTAEEVEAVLLRESLLRTHGKGTVECWVTDRSAHFNTLARRFFGNGLGRVRYCDITDAQSRF
ncbi:MAG: glutamate racemase [Calditrichota bacterium]